MKRELEVYLHQEKVGLLSQNEYGDMTFHYFEAWLQNPRSVPLSHSLPLNPGQYSTRECRGFFAGILPESHNRKIIARNLGISAQNDLAMLFEIGRECAGAVVLIPKGVYLPPENYHYRKINDAQLAEVLRNLPLRPLMAGEKDIRLSLAGAQDKIAVHVTNHTMSIPLGGAPSTHIIKPAIAQYSGVVFNEALCMKLAAAIGLSVSPVTIAKAEEIDYLLVERYDREIKSHKLLRVHQEDFCQAMGIVPEHKYQNEGGPSLKQCFTLLREVSSTPVIDLRSLLDAVIFNFLVGNHDAHGKNFSLLYLATTTKLSPLYDILCTAFYPDLSSKMAMKIGGEYQAEKITIKHFESLAEEIGFARPQVKKRVLQLAENILEKISSVTIEHKVSHAVSELIRKRCQSVLNGNLN